MHVRTMLPVIRLLPIGVVLMLTARVSWMTVTMMTVAVMDVAMLTVRMRVHNEPGESADRSSHGLADPGRHRKDERQQPDKVCTTSSDSLEKHQHVPGLARWIEHGERGLSRAKAQAAIAAKLKLGRCEQIKATLAFTA